MTGRKDIFSKTDCANNFFKKEITLFFLSILLFFFAVSFGNAQSHVAEKGLIRGEVVDEHYQKPVQYASISLYRHNDSSLVDGTITDSTGGFSLKASWGDYYLRISFMGYRETFIRNIPLRSGEKHVDLGTVYLQTDVRSIEEVEINADKPFIRYQADKKVINVSGDVNASSGSVVDVLEKVPSIEADIEGNVTLRGSSDFKVYINGKPSVLEGSDALQQIPAAMVKDVEIITNPSARYDAEGVAGIINVILKDNESAGFNGVINVSAGTGKKYSSDVLFNYRLDKWTFSAGANWAERNMSMTRENLREANYGDTMTSVHNRSDGLFYRDRRGMHSGIEFNPDTSNAFMLKLEYNERMRGRDFSGLYETISNPGSTRYDHRETWHDHDVRNFGSSFDYTHFFDGERHKFNVTAFFDHYIVKDKEGMEEFRTGPGGMKIFSERYREDADKNERTSRFRLKGDYVNTFEEDMKFEAGWQMTLEQKRQYYDFAVFDTVADEWQSDLSKSFEVDFYEHIYATYFIYSGSLYSFDYQLGLRPEYTDRFLKQRTLNEDYSINRMDFFPSVHLSRPFGSGHEATISYSRRIRRPHEWELNPFPTYYDQLNYRIGNPALNPEYINSYELGYQKKFGRRNIFSAEVYYRETNNVISRISQLESNNIIRHTYVNINRDYAVGVELGMNGHLAKWWNINLSGDFYNYSIEGELEEDNINRARLTWGGRLHSVISLPADLKWQVSGFFRAPTVTAQGERDAFLMLNSGIKKDLFNKKATVSFRVRDVLSTLRFNVTSSGSNFYNEFTFDRESPVFYLSLSYKINNYKPKDAPAGSVEMDYGNDF